MGQQCISLDSSLEPTCRRAERLSIFAWAFRYPGEPDVPTVQEAEEALAIGLEVYEAVIARLPVQVHP